MTARARGASVAAMSFAVMTLACEAPLGPVEPSSEPLQGEWIACLNDGAGDYTRQLRFYPDSFASTTRTFATTDRTCAGAETGTSDEIWRYRLGEQVTASIEGVGAEVLAREMNIENSFESLFTIVYIDRLATPPLLYFGDLAFDPLQDGTAPEKRPDVLSASPVLIGE
jgi:hypothetical protein